MADLRTNKLKVIHICSSSNGGAGIAAIRLHEALLEYGFESKMLFLSGNKQVTEGYYYNKLKVFDATGWKRINKVKNYVYRVYKAILPDRFKKKTPDLTRRLSSKVEIFTSPITNYNIEDHPLVKDADIVQLHWVAGFLDWQTFFKKINKPVCWYFHDMNPLLGGIHYSLDEMNVQRSLLGDLDRKFNRIKDLHIKEVNELYIQCDSYWLTRITDNSLRFKHARSIETIHYSLDFNTYFPIPKDVAKKSLNIEKNKTVILFGADNLENKRKGYDLLMEALSDLNFRDLVVCTFGSRNTMDANGLTSKAVVSYGKISNTSLHRLIYSSADLFVIPSRQEAFGQTALESLACGTPVVGFDTGGIPDIIIDGENGVLVKDISAACLSKEIDALICNKQKLCYVTRNARKSIINKFSKENQVVAFKEVYARVLDEWEND